MLLLKRLLLFIYFKPQKIFLLCSQDSFTLLSIYSLCIVLCSSLHFHVSFWDHFYLNNSFGISFKSGLLLLTSLFLFVYKVISSSVSKNIFTEYRILECKLLLFSILKMSFHWLWPPSFLLRSQLSVLLLLV